MTAKDLLLEAEHRPWPLPTRPWAMGMRWLDLAFLHWPVAPEVIEPHLPRGLKVDTYEGQAYLGVVPFRMSHVAPRFTFPVPGLSYFPELNLRTYVRCADRPGVWFFSLDVTSRVCVVSARTFFHLPYRHARMELAPSEGGWSVSSELMERGQRFAFDASYRGTGPVTQSAAGSLEAWLTERYCLYSANASGKLFRGEVHHPAWPLQSGQAEIRENTLADGLGEGLLSGPPLVHVSSGVDVLAWLLETVPIED